MVNHDVERTASANSANRVAETVPSTAVASPMNAIGDWAPANVQSVLDMLLAMSRQLWPDTAEADEKEVRRQWDEAGTGACFVAIEKHLGGIEEQMLRHRKYKKENLEAIKFYRMRIQQMRETTHKNLLTLIHAADGWFSWKAVKYSADCRGTNIKNEMLNDIREAPSSFSKAIKLLEDEYEFSKTDSGAAAPNLIDVSDESAEETERRLKSKLTEAVAKSIDATPEQAEKLQELFKSALEPGEFAEAALAVAKTTIIDLQKSITGKTNELSKLLKDQSKHGISAASYIWAFCQALIMLFGIVCGILMLLRRCMPEALTCRSYWREPSPRIVEEE